MKLEIPETEKQIGIELYCTDSDGIKGILRQEVQDFIVNEISNIKELEEGKHLILNFTKRNWDLHHIIRNLSRKLGISQKRIGYAGTKDKRAITKQKISIYNIQKEVIDSIKIKDLDLEFRGYSNKQIQLGDLIGNEFKIIIRNIELDEQTLHSRIKCTTDKIKELGGVPCFFGIQRFGAFRPITHDIGKSIVKGNLKEAAIAYIAKSYIHEPLETRRVRDFVFKTHDYDYGLKEYPLHLRYERAMMHHLKTNVDDFIGAFTVLPKGIYKIFIHAYQSYIFNKILSKRIKEGLPLNSAIDGDIVCFKSDIGLPNVHKTQKVTLKNLAGINNLIKRKRAFVTAPLIGYDTEFASGRMGEIEMQVFKNENISCEYFKIPDMSDMSSKGMRREILLSVNPKFKVESDELNSNMFKTTLEFSLPKGSYATTVLREYMKAEPIDMS
jgi:tRNA pseudouridine13 synthase